MTKTDRNLNRVLFEMLDAAKSANRKLQIAAVILELNWQNWGLNELPPEAARILGLPSGKRPRVHTRI
jgi:hypothetical protein